MHTLAALERIFREVFDDSTMKISPTTSPADIAGWDSVGQVKLVLAIEAEFEFRFTMEEAAGLKTAGDFLNAIDKHASAKA